VVFLDTRGERSVEAQAGLDTNGEQIDRVWQALADAGLRRCTALASTIFGAR
jgi:hypothetical protein